MSKPLTVGGLFSGIGGWELGLERAGMEVAWHCEADPFCRRVLEKHWPGVPTFEDVCTLTAGMAEGVDVLCGGFPCQDISLAGKGAGIDGARSGLWSEYARLIGEFRPRYVCVENVSALLGRGLDRVLSDLSALGFDAEWDCIPASAFGAPHRRDRVWLVAYPQRDELREQSGWGRGTRRPGRALASVDGEAWLVAHPQREHDRAEVDCGQADGADSAGPAGRTSGSGHGSGAGNVANAISIGRESRTRYIRSAGWQATLGAEGHRELAGSSWWAVEPDMGRVAHGVPRRVDRLRSLGNALVPQIAEWIGRRIVAYEDSLDGVSTA